MDNCCAESGCSYTDVYCDEKPCLIASCDEANGSDCTAVGN